MTDEYSGYEAVRKDYDHSKVAHSKLQFVEGLTHTNSIENFWSLLKRGLHGTYVSVEPKHLFRYVDERAFTYNERKLSDYGRFARVLRVIAGRRMTWAELTGRA